MPYDIQWLLEKRIIHMRDYGDCKIEELDDAINSMHELLDQGLNPVHIIHDNRDVLKYPLSLNTLKSVVKKHPKTGWIMFISQDKTSRFISSVLSSIAGQKAKQCTHFNEAIMTLQKQDESLPEEIPIRLQNIRTD